MHAGSSCWFPLACPAKMESSDYRNVAGVPLTFVQFVENPHHILYWFLPHAVPRSRATTTFKCNWDPPIRSVHWKIHARSSCWSYYVSTPKWGATTAGEMQAQLFAFLSMHSKIIVKRWCSCHFNAQNWIDSNAHC